ncbi:helicase HerA domain-containing protein [Halosimplex amylolyticum]|uniref:ATP-binding protein n=1 Tax=Halosimplex amylolyticum TaxID=3396616 RepID=UPI003F56626A
MADTPDAITLSEDGFSMPTLEVLTGRGFITGKSGSGKSNTVSVVAEELLAAEVPLLIVDTDGEYYGLKEEFELLHVGGDDHCDLQVTPANAEQIAAVALDRQVPVILDISGYRDPDEGHALVGEVVEELFVREKTAKTPFLVIVEEAHEFVPEQGGRDEVGETLIRVAKRGRKRGLGVCALSQRPASVSKDYITQCDWLVWHRLTWENDTKVVGRILGDDAAEDVEELDDGEAIVMTDWDDRVQRVTFRRKRTFDAGATPDLDSVDRPDLKSVDGDLLAELQSAVDADVTGENATDKTNGGASDTGDSTDHGSTGLAEEGSAGDDASAESSDSNGADGSVDDDLAEADGATANATASNTGTTGGRASGAAATTAASDGGAEPATDPAWEAAQFLTYLTGGIVAAAGRGVGFLARSGGRALTWTASRLSDTPRGRRRVEALLPKVLLVALGLLLGLAVGLLIV